MEVKGLESTRWLMGMWADQLTPVGKCHDGTMWDLMVDLK